MQVIEEPMKGLKLIKPLVFEDQRGYFYEAYSRTVFNKLGIDEEFVQDNQSLSTEKGVLRGLHFQNPPFAQGKLVKVTKGAVLDVAVDIRKTSPTYGQKYEIILSEENKLMLYIPPGFAHGFVTLEEDTIFTYKCTNYYSKESEGGILWCDEDLAIDWNVSNPILSEKDKIHPTFNEFVSQFE